MSSRSGFMEGYLGFANRSAIQVAKAAVPLALFLGLTAHAGAAPPDTVKLPAGLDYGGGSFYDGFGPTNPGWLFIDYARWDDLTSIRDSSGRSSPLFRDPHIDAYSNIFHAVYFTPIPVPGGALAFEALLPIVGFDSHFNQPGLLLRDNGWNIGDLTFGTDYQSRPIPLGGLSLLSLRAGLDFIAPIGSFDKNRDLNQGAGFWSVTPYLALTVLPLPKWEVSARVTYDYNFSTTRAADPPSIPGFTFQNGQAGQAFVVGFASSYEILNGIRPGINGFWVQQLTDDRTNGLNVLHTEEDQLYLGPGLSWQPTSDNIVNFNIYLPVFADNSPAGVEFNIQYLHPFRVR